MLWSDPFRFWSDALATGAAVTRTGLRFGEMLAASHEVIGHRSHIIGEACRDPLGADYPELERMVSEKVEAFWQAGTAVAEDIAAAQSLAWRNWQEVAALTAGGRVPSPAEARRLANRSGSIARRTGAAAAKALEPLHAKATANARRLRRPKAGIR